MGFLPRRAGQTWHLVDPRKPDRRRADNEAQIIEGSEIDSVIAELRAQLKEYRAEVHFFRNEVQALQGELKTANRFSNQRADRIETLQIIVELLLSELEKLDPDSLVVKQAKIMLRRTATEPRDPSESEAMATARGTVRDAKQAVRSAEHTVVEINVNEAKDRPWPSSARSSSMQPGRSVPSLMMPRTSSYSTGRSTRPCASPRQPSPPRARRKVLVVGSAPPASL